MSFQGGFEAGEEEKVCGGNIGAVWWLWHHHDVVFGQVVRHTEGCVARRIVVMEPPGLCDGWADADDAFRSRSRTDRECSFLMEVLERLRKRIVRPAIAKSWRLYHDNAPSHTAFRVTDHLAKHNIAMVPQPPYSPDVAPADFFLFPRLKPSLKGHRHGSVEALQ